MIKVFLIIAVSIFATQASANVEYLCNAWSGTYSNGQPFILKKENTVLNFKNYLGHSVTATFIGNHSADYSIYQDNWGGKDDNRIYYFNDFSDPKVTEHDLTLIMTIPASFNFEAKCSP